MEQRAGCESCSGYSKLKMSSMQTDKMDRIIEKKHGFWLKKYGLYAAMGALLLAMICWILFGNHASTVRVEKDQLTVSEVQKAEFKDYVRTSGRVIPIQVVQVSPEEGGIVVEKVVEEGSMVRKGDIIVRLSNSNLDLQILNAEAELAEKQNLLRNTQVAMQQDRLNNQTEQAQLDMDTQRKQRTFEQNRRLYQEKLISRESYLQSQEDWQLASKKRSLVTKRLKQDSLYRTVQMDQMEDNLGAMRRNVLLVRQRKDKLCVRSAIDGELGLLDVELGQSVQPGQKIGQINDLSDYRCRRRLMNTTSTACDRDSTLPLRVAKDYGMATERRESNSISCKCARSIPRCVKVSSVVTLSFAAIARNSCAAGRLSTSILNWDCPNRPC